MKYAGIFFGVFLGIIVLYFVIGFTGAALGFLYLPLFQLKSKINTNYGIIQKTYNADNAIYNYHWFKEQEGAIEALKAQIPQSQAALDNFESSLPKDRTQWGFEDKTEDSRLRSVLLGQKQQLESLVNEYNARAKEADRAIFQNGLPLFINL